MYSGYISLSVVWSTDNCYRYSKDMLMRPHSGLKKGSVNSGPVPLLSCLNRITYYIRIM